MPSFVKRVMTALANKQPAKIMRKMAVRLYSGGRQTPFTYGFGSAGNSSADSELVGQLTLLRARSRQLVRDNAFAKRGRTLVVNNVIGSGVGMQAQVMTTRGEPADTVNRAIEASWKQWCRASRCHTGGTLHFADMERAAMSEVFTAGEAILRKHYRPFGDSTIPFALELIEPERLADNVNVPMPAAVSGNVRLGVEVDEFQRPIAYFINAKHPGDRRWGSIEVDKVMRVPASEIIHLKLTDRWPMTRGEPWMHTVLRKLDDIGEYSSSEVQAARASSYYFGTIETPAPDGDPLATISAEGVSPAQMEIEPGLIQALPPGEKFNFHTPTRPNTAIDAFISFMLREVAVGIGASYASLSGDYSQSNYSSSRLALLDDRDLWRMLQAWWIRSFREPLHEEWLRQAVLARAIDGFPLDAYVSDPARYGAARFKVRGWGWIDPQKEVAAYKEARKAGFISTTQVIEQTANGADIEDVIEQIKRETALFEEAGIELDTDPDAFMPAAEAPPDSPEEDATPTTRPARVVSFGR